MFSFVIPGYSIFGFITFATISTQQFLALGNNSPTVGDYLTTLRYGVLLAVIGAFAQLLVWGGVLYWFDALKNNTLSRNAQENDEAEESSERDVVSEENKTAEFINEWQNVGDGVSAPLLVVDKLRKVFAKFSLGCGKKKKDEEVDDKNKDKIAVDGISFRVLPNEVFGLLGPNGAGKTTTISMIVGEAKPSAGRIVVNGIDAIKRPIPSRQYLGYCPQHDSLWDLGTPGT